MDIDKANRVRSYVQAQLAFVPFYETHFLAPCGSHSEAVGLQTPLLTARNPLVTIQPEFIPSSTSTSDCINVRGSKCGLTEADSMLTKKAAPAKRPMVIKEQNQRLLTLERGTRITSDPDASSEPAEDRSLKKRKRGRRREKLRFPTGLSFLYGFSPENVGPSRLTVSRSNAIMNPKFIISRYLLVIKGFLRKESHLRLHMVSLPWTRLVGLVPSSAVAVIHLFINSAACFSPEA